MEDRESVPKLDPLSMPASEPPKQEFKKLDLVAIDVCDFLKMDFSGVKHRGRTYRHWSKP